MKRIIITALAATLMFSLMPTGVAAATGGSGSKNEITIQRDAQYDILGSIIHVGLNVKCQSSPLGLPGQVEVMVTQEPPETPYPISIGSGLQNVVCDGKTHTVGVSIFGEGFDAGRAQASAILLPAVDTSVGKTFSAERTINITPMS